MFPKMYSPVKASLGYVVSLIINNVYLVGVTKLAMKIQIMTSKKAKI